MWILHFDPVKRCKNVNFIEKTDGTVFGEDEFLFAPCTLPRLELGARDAPQRNRILVTSRDAPQRNRILVTSSDLHVRRLDLYRAERQLGHHAEADRLRAGVPHD